MVAEEIVSIVLFIRLENCCAKWRTRSGISPWRSRSGGSRGGEKFNRKKKAEGGFFSAAHAFQTRVVGANKRASGRRVRELPHRFESRPFRTRRPLVCH